MNLFINKFVRVLTYLLDRCMLCIDMKIPYCDVFSYSEWWRYIGSDLGIDTATMLWLMRNPVMNRSIEYADNRISLYAAQYGNCAVTGIHMEPHDIHCHHKVPVSQGGSDEYANLTLVRKEVHIVIHATSEPTIKEYLKSLNLDKKQIKKLNKLRTMAGTPTIIL